jgi:hypothetical protein
LFFSRSLAKEINLLEKSLSSLKKWTPGYQITLQHLKEEPFLEKLNLNGILLLIKKQIVSISQINGSIEGFCQCRVKSKTCFAFES